MTGEDVRPKVLLVEEELECSATPAVAFEVGDAPPFQHASTAKQALAILHDRPVAALITDFNLPAMDGLELIRRVRAEPRMAALPIVVTTAMPTPPPTRARSCWEPTRPSPSPIRPLPYGRRSRS